MLNNLRTGLTTKAALGLFVVVASLATLSAAMTWWYWGHGPGGQPVGRFKGPLQCWRLHAKVQGSEDVFVVRHDDGSCEIQGIEV